MPRLSLLRLVDELGTLHCLHSECATDTSPIVQVKHTCRSSLPEAVQAHYTTSATTESSPHPDTPLIHHQRSLLPNPHEAAAAISPPNPSMTSERASSCRRFCCLMQGASTGAGTHLILRGRFRLGMAAGIQRRERRCIRSCSRCKRCAVLRRRKKITLTLFDRRPRRSAKPARIGTTCIFYVTVFYARNLLRSESSRVPSMRCWIPGYLRRSSRMD
jgi:hypothetical protein